MKLKDIQRIINVYERPIHFVVEDELFTNHVGLETSSPESINNLLLKISHLEVLEIRTQPYKSTKVLSVRLRQEPKNVCSNVCSDLLRLFEDLHNLIVHQEAWKIPQSVIDAKRSEYTNARKELKEVE